jgi:hypothetical protein
MFDFDSISDFLFTVGTAQCANDAYDDTSDDRDRVHFDSADHSNTYFDQNDHMMHHIPGMN